MDSQKPQKKSALPLQFFELGDQTYRVAIQGYEGSFHQEAARQYFGEKVSVIPCATFREVIQVGGRKRESDGAVMAIENSIAGSILSNYNLLQKSSLQVTGEVYLHIRQNLMANPGVQLADIQEVHSHTMALQQCYDYLDRFKWKLVETEDTALSARHIQQHKSKHIAAIASRLAAELYQLEILAPSIQTMKKNFTRFLILQRPENAQIPPNANKASVNFVTDHTRGSLARVLSLIANGGINLSKLQSVPIAGSDFKYSFHADMEFETPDQFFCLLQQMERATAAIRVYGVYRNGKEKLVQHQ